MSVIHAKPYNPKKRYDGRWDVTYKIDGVRAIVDSDGRAFSKGGKELVELAGLMTPGDYEVYAGNWADSISVVRGTKKWDPRYAHSLAPLDRRLDAGYTDSMAPEDVQDMLEIAVSLGYEGIVFRQGDVWIKRKPKETYDVKVLGLIEGQGRLKGVLGAFITERGNVGQGITDDERSDYWERRNSLLHTIIEVECDRLTPNGQFRHGRFKRLRPDK